MIRIRRQGQPPVAMVGKESPAARELEANRALARARQLEAMKFAVYRDASVKSALDGLFHRKCAYCESYLLGTQAGDVEHYRPKGKVAVRDAKGKTVFKPGYYWLAADWSNLLPSCADCNRPRTQNIVGAGRRVIGKANWFPVADERRRAKNPRQVAAEPRLLLDPCVDDPERHLSFSETGEIMPRKVRDKPSAMGMATIDTCGLSRVELLQRRVRHKRIVMASIRHTLEALEAGRDPGTDLDDLLALLSPAEEYVAFTRFLVRLHMKKYLSRLGL